MKRFKLWVLVTTVTAYWLSISTALANNQQDTSVYAVNATAMTQVERLESLKQIFLANTHNTYFNYLFGFADAFVGSPPLSVTSNLTLPVSGVKNDYFSVGPYWWPDPSKGDGLPWIRKDGEVNRAVRGPDTDAKLFSALANRLQVLSHSYYLTGKREYLIAAERLITAWFVEPLTAMTPHLNYAQSIPGRSHGRGIGIIEVRDMTKVLNAVTLLRPNLSAASNAELEQWMTIFLGWLIESKNGKDEAAMHNNHGTFYDVIVTSLAVYLGFDDIAKKVLARTAQRTMQQIDETGLQPHEMERTKPFHYSAFNLMAFATQVKLASSIKLSFNQQFPKASERIIAALNFQLNNIENTDLWPGSQERSLPVERVVAVAMLLKTEPQLDPQIVIPETVLAQYPEAQRTLTNCAFWLSGNTQFLQLDSAQPSLCASSL